MKPVNFISIVICITILFGVCLNSGCDNAPYKPFTMDEGIAHFSFEYPTRFKVAGYDAIDDLSYVNLVGPKDRKINDYPSIGITVWTRGKYHTSDAQSMLNDTIRKFSDWPDFKLLEQSEVTVAGIQAELLAYTHRNLQPIDRGLDEPLKEVYWEIYFDYNEFVWKFVLRSDSSTAEADKAVFQHVVDTFKILE